jgi:hypothetical protein
MADPPDAPLPRLYGCGGCTHSRIPRDREASGGGADENEFECLLLGRAETRRRVKDKDPWRDPELVWGENPICTDADWPVYEVAAPPDTLSPRPNKDDADALRILSDWLEEQGNDPGAALLRDVAGRIERDVRPREAIGKPRHSTLYPGLDDPARLRDIKDMVTRMLSERLQAVSPAGDVSTGDTGALDRELRFYRSHLDALLGAGDVNEGRYVVIKGSAAGVCEVAGVRDTFEEALKLGYGRYGLKPFLVKKIERVETIHYFSRDLP